MGRRNPAGAWPTKSPHEPVYVMTIMRTTLGINRAECAGPAHGQISSTDALQRVFPTTVSSYLQFRGWICQETLCDRSSVTFDLRQQGQRVGLGHDLSGSPTALGP